MKIFEKAAISASIVSLMLALWPLLGGGESSLVAWVAFVFFILLTIYFHKKSASDLFVQEGEVLIAERKDKQFPVIYPMPFQFTPNLTLKIDGAITLEHEVVEERPDGFIFKIGCVSRNGTPKIIWKAIGQKNITT